VPLDGDNMPIRLNDRQRKILKYIKNYISKYGYSPNAKEIAGALDISTSAVYANLTILKAAGAISKDIQVNEVTTNDSNSG